MSYRFYHNSRLELGNERKVELGVLSLSKQN